MKNLKAQIGLLVVNRKKRKPFPMRVKKEEWRLAAKKVTFTKKSKCRECPRILTWGDGTYNFDHKDNNSANISQRNCYLVCRNCHGKNTKFGTREYRGLLGEVEGHKRIKKKVGYKKPKKPKRPKRRAIRDMFGNVIGYRTVKPRKKTKKTSKKRPKRRKKSTSGFDLGFRFR